MRFHEGDIIELPQTGLCRVLLVSDCRMRVAPVAKRHALIAGNDIEFNSRAFDISPNSEVPVVDHDAIGAQP